MNFHFNENSVIYCHLTVVKYVLRWIWIRITFLNHPYQNFLYLANFVSVNKQVEAMVNKNPAPIISLVSCVNTEMSTIYFTFCHIHYHIYRSILVFARVCLHVAVSHNFQLFFCLIKLFCRCNILDMISAIDLSNLQFIAVSIKCIGIGISSCWISFKVKCHVWCIFIIPNDNVLPVADVF